MKKYDAPTVEVSRDWLAHVRDVLSGPLPSGRIGDAVFLLRDQIGDVLAKPTSPQAGVMPFEPGEEKL